jgi:hypothetical protein
VKFWRNKAGMSGLIIGSVVTLLLLFLQNSGSISLSVPIFAVLWWVLAWPFTFAALIVAFTATGNQMSPSWGLPLLLISIIANLLYFYGLGVLVGFISSRMKGVKTGS